MSKDTLPKLPKLPEFRATKSGYEIRAEILKQAQDLLGQEYQVKWQGWEMTGKRDSKTGEFVHTVEMPPYPGLDTVLATAERMYDFVKKNDN